MTEQGFLRTIAERLRCDERRAEGLAFAVFQVLRDRLTAKEAADVASQLPAGLKRLWEEERPARQVARIHEQEFVGLVREWAGLPDDAEATRAVKVVFGELQRLLGSPSGLEGEAWDVFSVLPKDLKRLWLEAGRETHV
jgi:uncharacterized protein (DUF2267 family)